MSLNIFALCSFFCCPYRSTSSSALSDASSIRHTQLVPSPHRGPGYAPYFGRASGSGRWWSGLGLSTPPGTGTCFRAEGACHEPGRRRRQREDPRGTQRAPGSLSPSLQKVPFCLRAWVSPPTPSGELTKGLGPDNWAWHEASFTAP